MTDTADRPTRGADVPTADDIIARLFEQREAGRTAAVTRLLAGLTEREVLLIKEAAVMGWVQGMRHHDLPYPGDKQALVTVLDACIAFSDLYPTITAQEQP